MPGNRTKQIPGMLGDDGLGPRGGHGQQPRLDLVRRHGRDRADIRRWQQPAYPRNGFGSLRGVGTGTPTLESARAA
jgi:hypothetical protein